jgi:hypothetical protein
MMLVTAENFEQARASYGDEYLILHGVACLVTCEHCNGYAAVPVSVVCSRWSDPADAHAEVPCPECEGDGRVCVFVQPVGCDDDCDREADGR